MTFFLIYYIGLRSSRRGGVYHFVKLVNFELRGVIFTRPALVNYGARYRDAIRDTKIGAGSTLKQGR